MHAIVVSEYGSPAEIREVPAPTPHPGQLLIRVLAAGMNPMDRVIAAGEWQPFMPATFPMVLGVDVAGTVEKLGDGSSRFAVGEAVMGQLLTPPLGSSGTYAEYVAVAVDATLAHIPPGMDPAVAASAPTAGMTGLSILDSLAPLASKAVLIVGAAGGVGSFATQLAGDAGAHVTGRANTVERLRSYGVDDTVDPTATSVPQAVARLHPHGVDVLVDLASDTEAFATLTALVRDGGTALSTRYVADSGALAAKGVTGINFRLPASTELLERVAHALAAGSIAPPPIHRISLTQTPAAFAGTNGPADGKTVIVL